MITFNETEISINKSTEKQIHKKCAMIGNFETGPCLEIVNVTNTDEFKKTFGYPNKENYIEWHNAFNYLQYSDNLDIVRVIKRNIRNSGLKFSDTVETIFETNLYNKTVAEEKLNSLNNTGILFFNKFSKTEQDLAIIICKNETDWSKSISNEIVTKTDNKFSYITYNSNIIRLAYSSKIQNQTSGYVKSFKELIQYKPNFNNNEFLVLVLKQNYSGVYDLIENFIVSTNQEAINFIDDKFLNISNYVYAKYFSIPTVDNTSLSITNMVFKKSVYSKVNFCDLKEDFDSAMLVLEDSTANIFMAYECYKTIASVNYLCIDEMCNILSTKPNSLIIMNPFSEKRYEPNINNEETIVQKILEDFSSTREGVITNNYFNSFSQNVLIYVGTKYQYSLYMNKMLYLPFLGDICGLISSSKKYEIVAGPTKSIIKNCKDSLFNFSKESLDILKFNGINSIIKVYYNNNFFLSNMRTSKSESDVYKNARNIVLENEIKNDLIVRLQPYENKTNDSILRSQVSNECIRYLNILKGQKVLDNFRVVCDLTNNTDGSNTLVVNIYLNVVGYIEEIIVNIQIL